MNYGLEPRPQLPPEEMAAVIAAVQEVTREVDVIGDPVDHVPVWRFSGRWFNYGRYTLRRPNLH